MRMIRWREGDAAIGAHLCSVFQIALVPLKIFLVAGGLGRKDFPELCQITDVTVQKGVRLGCTALQLHIRSEVYFNQCQCFSGCVRLIIQSSVLSSPLSGLSGDVDTV